jgi:anti-anti-sigma factor
MVIIRREVSGTELELAVSGDLNKETVGEFRSTLYAERGKPYQLISLNMEKVHSINSAALGAVLLFQQKAREAGMGVRISRCSDELYRTLVDIRLDRIIELSGRGASSAQQR